MSCSPNELAQFPVIPRKVKSQRDMAKGRRCQKVLMVVRKALDKKFCHINSLKTSFCLLKLNIFDMKPVRPWRKVPLKEFSVFTLLGAGLVLYDPYLLITSGSGCRQSSRPQLRGVSKDLWVHDMMITVFCFAFQPDILSMAHVRCLTPSPALLFTSAMSLIMILSGNFTSIVNFFRYVCVRFLFASSVLVGFTWFISIFLHYLFEPGLLLSKQYWGEEEGRKKIKRLGTSTFAMHECFCY